MKHAGLQSKLIPDNSTGEKAEKEAKSSTGQGKSYPVLHKSICAFRGLGQRLGQKPHPRRFGRGCGF